MFCKALCSMGSPGWGAARGGPLSQPASSPTSCFLPGHRCNTLNKSLKQFLGLCRILPLSHTLMPHNFLNGKPQKTLFLHINIKHWKKAPYFKVEMVIIKKLFVLHWRIPLCLSLLFINHQSGINYYKSLKPKRRF